MEIVTLVNPNKTLKEQPRIVMLSRKETSPLTLLMVNEPEELYIDIKLICPDIVLPFTLYQPVPLFLPGFNRRNRNDNGYLLNQSKGKEENKKNYSQKYKNKNARRIQD